MVEGTILLIFGNPAALDSKVFRPSALRPILSNGLPLSFWDIICVNVHRLKFSRLLNIITSQFTKYHHQSLGKVLIIHLRTKETSLFRN